VGIFISDLVTPLYAAYSIMAALRHKDQTGEGQYLDASMMDTLATLMFMENIEETIAQGEPLRSGNETRGGPTGLYHTKDTDIIVTCASEEQWQRLCRALGTMQWHDDPRFTTAPARRENLALLRQAIQQELEQYTAAQAVAKLEHDDVPCAPVRSAADVLADEHFYQRGTLGPMAHGALETPVEGVAVGFPVVFSGGKLPPLSGAPTLGMHNQEVFHTLLGLDAEQLQAMQARGVI
jgi:crotonobetainyl-CoA:carnitine CoA-transferase CaiB-like acyl-CoA transferase